MIIMGDVTYGACCVDDFSAKAMGAQLMIHYGHSCLVPIDKTHGINMLYVFVDIKIDTKHFIDSVLYNFEPGCNLVLVSTIQFVAALQATAKALREKEYNVNITHLELPYLFLCFCDSPVGLSRGSEVFDPFT